MDLLSQLPPTTSPLSDPNALLAIEKAKFQVAIAAVADGVIVVDTHQQVITLNDAAQKLTGYDSTEIISKNVGVFIKIYEGSRQIMPEEFCPSGELDIEGTVFSKKSVILTDKTGNNKSVNIETKKIKHGSVADIGGLIIITDVSSESELERMKLDFISMSVHSLRTPITVLKGYLHMLLKEETVAKLDDKEISYINSSVASANRLKDLVESIFVLSELQEGIYKPVTTAFNMEGVIRKTMKEYQSIAQNKGLVLAFVPTTTQALMVRGDVSDITLVLSALLENAIKFTERGKITISLVEKDNFVVVAVMDTGKGISKDSIPHLFTKFYRVKKSPLIMEYGSGLGLYISKKIIDSHGGNMWVESEEGKGSIFYFSLPVYRP